MDSLTDQHLYTVWLDGTIRLFIATGKQIKAMDFDYFIVDRLTFSYKGDS